MSLIKFKMEEVVVLADFCSHSHGLFHTGGSSEADPVATAVHPCPGGIDSNETWSWFEILLLRTETRNSW